MHIQAILEKQSTQLALILEVLCEGHPAHTLLNPDSASLTGEMKGPLISAGRISSARESRTSQFLSAVMSHKVDTSLTGLNVNPTVQTISTSCSGNRIGACNEDQSRQISITSMVASQSCDSSLVNIGSGSYADIITEAGKSEPICVLAPASSSCLETASSVQTTLRVQGMCCDCHHAECCCSREQSGKICLVGTVKQPSETGPSGLPLTLSSGGFTTENVRNSEVCSIGNSPGYKEMRPLEPAILLSHQITSHKVLTTREASSAPASLRLFI